jgi:GNAT superfamily N-acetyltransferase
VSTLRRLTQEDLARLRQFWVEHWCGEEMIAHGVIHHPKQLDGYVVENGDEWIGLVTFLIRDGQCEITSLDSLQEGQGIGTKLIGRVLEEARKNDCRRLFLITTNDNLNALGFYQKRGFELVQIQRGAVNVSRKIKPGIPLVGMNDIPLRDEIELEIRLT